MTAAATVVSVSPRSPHREAPCLAALLSAAPGIDLDATDERGWTALMEAAEAGRDAAVAVLLRAGASVEPRDARGCSALDLALASRAAGDCPEDDSTCRLLLAAGADPADIWRRELADDLARAVLRGDHRGVRRLLDAGASPQLPGRPSDDAATDERSPLFIAAANGDVETVRMLLEQGAGARLRNEEAPAGYAAAEGGHVAIVELMLAHGASPELGGLGHDSPLVGAAERGSVEVLERLLAASPRAYAMSDALGAAAAAGRLDSCLALLRAGADIGARYGGPGCLVFWSGGTPLAWAAHHGRVDAMRLLHEHGADPDAAPAGAEPPIIAAARNGQLAAVDLLLAWGADPNQRGPEGLTALAAARAFVAGWPFASEDEARRARAEAAAVEERLRAAGAR